MIALEVIHDRHPMSRLVHLAGIWTCGVRAHVQMPGGCWSADHISIDQIVDDTKMCSMNCECWRHAIISYVYTHRENNGA